MTPRRRTPSSVVETSAATGCGNGSQSSVSNASFESENSRQLMVDSESESDTVIVFRAASARGRGQAAARDSRTSSTPSAVLPGNGACRDADSESDNNSVANVRATLLKSPWPTAKAAKLSSTSLLTLKQSLLTIRESKVGRQLYVALVILFFAGSSLGAIFINKTCLTGYHFRYPLVLMLGQMAFAIFILTLLHAANYMRIPVLRPRDLPLILVPTILFMSNVVVGLSALSLVNIPMFSAFRRLTLLFVMGAEYVLLKKTHSPAIINAVVVMTFGAFISALDDVSFSRLGYFLVFLNNLLTALYLASIKRVMRETEFEPLSLLYYTALMGAPIVAVLILATGELRNVVTAFNTQPELLTPGFLMSLTLTATGAFAVNFSTSLCTHVTSPLSTSVAGQVKNIFQTVLGFWSWGFVPTTMNVAGLLVALAAQLVFATIKYKENREAEDKAEESAHQPGNTALSTTECSVPVGVTASTGGRA
jgi:drug/metabolite transporter (DMT)-like permease